MSEEDAKKLIGIMAALAIFSVVVTLMATGGDIRLEQYRVKAEDYGKENGIDLEYTRKTLLDSQEAFFQEMSSLIKWDIETRKAIDTVYECDDSTYGDAVFDKEKPFLLGLRSSRRIKDYTKKYLWKDLREQLTERVYEEIASIYREMSTDSPVYEDTVRDFYYEDGFDKIYTLLEYLEKGKGKEVYRILIDKQDGIWRDEMGYDCSIFALGVCYYTYPEVVLEVCAEDEREALQKGDLGYLYKIEVSYDEWFANWKYDYYRAQNHISNTYSSPSFSSSSSSASSYAEIDPDDYDIEGYYEDYKDLYDNYEDAYDGFLDDESVWDDYD